MMDTNSHNNEALEKYGIDVLGFISIQDLRLVLDKDLDDGERLKNAEIGKALASAQQVTRDYVLRAVNRVRLPKVRGCMEKERGLARGGEETHEAIEKILARVKGLSEREDIRLPERLSDANDIPANLDGWIAEQPQEPPRLTVVGEENGTGQDKDLFDLRKAFPWDIVDFWLSRWMPCVKENRRRSSCFLEQSLDEVADGFTRLMLELALDEFTDDEIRERAKDARTKEIAAFRRRLGMMATAFTAMAESDLERLLQGAFPLPAIADFETRIAAIEQVQVSPDQDEEELIANLLWIVRRVLAKGMFAAVGLEELIEDDFFRWGISQVLVGYECKDLSTLTSNRTEAFVQDFDTRLKIVEDICLAIRSGGDHYRVRGIACSHLTHTLPVEGMEDAP